MWCIESINVVSNNLLTLINRLFTAVLLVVLLFACQQTPENNNSKGGQMELQTN
jgi:hypothetical protein